MERSHGKANRCTDRSIMNQQQTILPEAVSMAEAAKIMSVSERSIWTLCNRGLLPTFKIGRSVRIRYVDIRRFMESGGETAKPDYSR
jgi:excisionase family DNA binding protein